jgi:hypothetical protein
MDGMPLPMLRRLSLRSPQPAARGFRPPHGAHSSAVAVRSARWRAIQLLMCGMIAGRTKAFIASRATPILANARHSCSTILPAPAPPAPNGHAAEAPVERPPVANPEPDPTLASLADVSGPPGTEPDLNKQELFDRYRLDFVAMMSIADLVAAYSSLSITEQAHFRELIDAED